LVNEVVGLDDNSAVAIAAVGYRDTDDHRRTSVPKVRMLRHELVERI
jgi:hypothetical protein